MVVRQSLRGGMAMTDLMRVIISPPIQACHPEPLILPSRRRERGSRRQPRSPFPFSPTRKKVAQKFQVQLVTPGMRGPQPRCPPHTPPACANRRLPCGAAPPPNPIPKSKSPGTRPGLLSVEPANLSASGACRPGCPGSAHRGRGGGPCLLRSPRSCLRTTRHDRHLRRRGYASPGGRGTCDRG